MYRKMICLVSFVLVLVLTNFAQAELIGYWRFDETSGTIAADSAGGDNDGILFGDQLEWTAGRFGGALSHGGMWDAGVEIPTTGMSATAGTVAMWGVLADPQPPHTKYFFGHTTQRQWTNRVQLYMDEGDNLLDIGLGESHTRDTDIVELPIEEWFHVALTWDSGNYVVYVNGENVATGTYTGLSDVNEVANIGNDGSAWPYEGFAGLLDEVRLYNHALNADNILYLLYPKQIECLVAHWKLDEIEGGIAYDSVGDNDGILYGNPIWQPMGGMLDGALEFDGDDDYVDCGTFNPSDATGQLSICLWAKWNGLNGRYQSLIGKRNSWNANDMMWQLEANHISGDARFEREGYAGFAGGILTEGDWEHWCVTFDGATAIIYRMGEEVNRGAFSFGSKTDAQVALGGSNAGNQFNGALDDVRIYDCALNTAEILAAMEGVEQVDITAPDDLVQGVPNDGITYDSGDFGWYSWESPDLVIDDNIDTKYLHFKGEIESTGFQVTPSAGASIVTGLTLTTANDFPARDPIAFELYGSNVSINGRYRLIAIGYIIDFDQVEAWPRLAMNATPISFNNDIAYEHYQVLFPVVRDAGRANSMQIAEVELLGVAAPRVANIILVTKEIDRDSDGLRDDHSLESFLISEGHHVDVRPDYWEVLTPYKIAQLNAADLIIVSRSAWSTYYNNGNEATEWNSLTTPLLLMNSHFARNIRWKWVNSDARAPDDTSYIYAGAVDQHHPIFRGVPLTLYDPTLRGGPLNAVEMVDPLVGAGFTAFIDGTDMGNGQLIAKPVGIEMGWIAEWDAGVEFYEGAEQFAGGKRMLFCAGTYYDDDIHEVTTTTKGELNLTAEGLQMFRNAIDYLLGLEITESVVGYVVEDFETNDFGNFPWSSYGDESWETTRSERHSGYFSARSGSIEDGEETSLEVRLDCVSGYITFYCKVSCESGFDELTFYIDGLEQGKWSGQEDWAEVSFHVREGTRTFKWAYSKDSFISEGDDTAWIDDIVFPIGP
ncbi:MAG: LamG domain-containing protein [Planctomycetes bacterium]|nr:LamG domain-containing protein [Planctomycetota bacterium]